MGTWLFPSGTAKPQYSIATCSFFVVGLGLCHGGWDGLAVHTWPGGVGQRQECRSQVCVTGHHVQGLVLWDSRASDDEGDIDVGFYTQLVT